MKVNSNIQQLFYYLLSGLLIAVIAVYCLKMNAPLSVYRWENKRSYQLNMYTAQKQSCFYIGSSMKSAPYAQKLVLKKVIDGQVYTLNKKQGKTSNIKKNLSLARLTIVTA